MKRIVAALLTFIFIQSSIAGICIPAFASESLGTEVSESFSEADIPAESAIDPYEEMISDDFETEEIEEAEVPGPADIIEEEDATLSLCDIIIPLIHKALIVDGIDHR